MSSPRSRPSRWIAHEFSRIDVVAVVGGVGAGVAAAGGRGDDAGAVVLEAAEQNTAALVGVGLLAVLAEGVVVVAGEFQHRGIIDF